MHNQSQTRKYASDKFLADRYEVSRATIWRWAKEGRIPKPRKIAPGTTRWLMAEIEAAEEVAG